jgi:polyphosphate kinase
MAKMNSLVDPVIIKALYRASQAGVKIRLNIRGVCCLRPGVPKLSENIEVISIIDRFLEHSRVFYFSHGGDDLVFISSADWMPRNLDRRVELMTPVEDRRSRDKLVDMLETCLGDKLKGRILKPNGGYERRTGTGAKKALGSQETLCRQARQRAKQAAVRRRTVFEPHRPSAADA